MRYFISLSIILFFCLCESTPLPELGGMTAIRIENASAYTFDHIVVNASGKEQHYGKLEPLFSSEYKLFELAYRYAFVELRIDGSVATIQPFDYFGETPLESGYYTYRITATASDSRYSRLSLELIED